MQIVVYVGAAAVFVALIATAMWTGLDHIGERVPGDDRSDRRRLLGVLLGHVDEPQGRTGGEDQGPGVYPAVHCQRRVLVTVPTDFTVLALYSDKRINWSIFGWTAPSNWIGSIEPVWIILLSPIFAVMWTRLGNRAPTTPRKFAYGVVGMGAAFLMFLPMAGTAGSRCPRR